MPMAVSPEVLDVTSLRRIVIGFRDALDAHRTRIDSLNVYPVPDGDTGTNMSLTLRSVVDEMDNASASVELPAAVESPADVESLCRAVAHGALMGARGNSGVIMAQVLRGMTDVLRDASRAGERLDANVVARAFAAASKGAYRAVGNPVEGTILTVIREVSEEALSVAEAGAGLAEMFDSAGARGYDALRRTPQMLDVLAEAGVVDAGGAGLMLLIDAGRAELSGRPMPQPEAVHTAPPPLPVKTAAADHSGEPSIADLRYEVMFLLDAEDSLVEGFKAAWAEIGDSIVVVGGEGVWNCHVHTDHIGAAIEAGIAVGRPHRIRVTDLLDEVAERDWVRSALKHSSSDDSEGQAANVEIADPDGCSVVAVGSGSGIVEILTSMGAHRVVAGGQSMNPSTAELLSAVESLPTGHVVVLPNNKNIIAVAEQLDSASERSVSVVPTTSVVAGVAALMSFDPLTDSEGNCRVMTAAAGDVIAGEVTRAVRDAVSGVGPVRAGDWLGIGPSGIVAVASDEAAAARRLLAQLVSDDEHELLTVIVGADANQASLDEIVNYVGHRHADLEVEVQHGGQPLYPYYFGLE